MSPERALRDAELLIARTSGRSIIRVDVYAVQAGPPRWRAWVDEASGPEGFGSSREEAKAALRGDRP